MQEGVAHDQKWKVGRSSRWSYSRAGSMPARIAGIFTRNQLVFANYVIPLSMYEQGFGTQQDSFVYVKLRRDGQRSARVAPQYSGPSRRSRPCRSHDRASSAATLDDQVQRALGVMWALLALAVLTGVLGIVNTLALSVFERTRELGLLRTVGMARRQVWTMIGGEAVLIALVGAVLGIALGWFLGWVLARILADDGIDVLRGPVPAARGFFVLAGVAGVVASIVPAWRASRLDVLDAIAHE